MEGAGRYDPVDENAGEIKYVFDRMHRESGPGSDIYVFMMQVMTEFIQWFPMDQSVYKVEVKESKINDTQG